MGLSIFFKLKAMKDSDLDKDGKIDEEEESYYWGRKKGFLRVW